MNTQEIKELACKLMETTDAAYLTTIDPDGFPHTRAMLNLRNPVKYPGLIQFFKEYGEDFTIYFSTNTSSKKIRHIPANPKVAVYYCQPNSFQGIMFGGEIEIIEDMAIKRALWQDGWEMYYPQGVTDPENSVLRLRPQFLRGWASMTHLELQL